MSKIMLYLSALYLLLHSCRMETRTVSIEKWKQEILETEQAFAKMAADEGIQEAFVTYAAENAVLARNNTLITGKQGISEFYENRYSQFKEANLHWVPDYIDVAESGEMGYTYGHYVFSYLDSTGNSVENEGVFHTVWKRQQDGTWRFVWD